MLVLCLKNNILSQFFKDLKIRKYIFITLITVLSVQVFPVDGICYLLGIGISQAQMEKNLMSNSDESDEDEDSMKIKKLDYFEELGIYNQQFKYQVLNANKLSLEISTSLGHQPELLIPPPNIS